MTSLSQSVTMQSITMQSIQDDSDKLPDMQVTLNPDRVTSWDRNKVDSRIASHYHHLAITNDNNNDNAELNCTDTWVAEVSLVSSDEELEEVNDDAEQIGRDLAAPVDAPSSARHRSGDVVEAGDDIVFVASVVRTPIKVTSAVTATVEQGFNGRAAATNGIASFTDVDHHNFSTECQRENPSADENVIGTGQRLSNGVVAVVGPVIGGRIRAAPVVQVTENGADVGDTAVAKTASKTCAVGAFYRQTAAVSMCEPPPRMALPTKPCLRERKTMDSQTTSAAAGKKTKDASSSPAPVNGSPRSPINARMAISTRGARVGRNATRISRDLFNGDGAAPTVQESANKRSRMNVTPPIPQQISNVSPGASGDKSSNGSVLDSPRRIVPPARWMSLMEGGEVAVVTSKRNVSPGAAIVPFAAHPSTATVRARELKKRRRMWKNGLVKRPKKKKPNDSVVKADKAVAVNNKIGKELPLTLPPGIDQPSMPVDGTMTPPPSSSSCSGEANSPTNLSATTTSPKVPNRRLSDLVEAPVAGPSTSGAPTNTQLLILQRPKKHVLARAERAKLAAVLRQLCPGKKKVSCELRDIYEHSVNSAKLAARQRSASSASRSASTSPRAKVPRERDSWWKIFSEISASPRVKRAPVNAGTTAIVTTKAASKSKTKTTTSPSSAHSPSSTIMRVSRGIFADKTKITRQNTATGISAPKSKSKKNAVTIDPKSGKAKKGGNKKIKKAIKVNGKEKAISTRNAHTGNKRNMPATTASDSSKKRVVAEVVTVKNKKNGASLSTVAAKKKRVAINRQLALGNKIVQAAGEVAKPTRRSASPASSTNLIQAVRKNGGKTKTNNGELFKQSSTEACRAVVSPAIMVLPKQTVSLPRKVAARLVKADPAQRSPSPAPITVKNLVKVANDLLNLASTDKSAILTPPRPKGANKTRSSKKEKRAKDGGKRTKKSSTEASKLGLSQASARLSSSKVATATTSRYSVSITHERTGQANGVQPAKVVRPRLSLGKGTAVTQRRASSPSVHRDLLTGNGHPAVGGYNGVSHTSNAIKRSSVRQAECAFRYREIGVKRHSNFIQIVLISNTRVRNGLNAQVLFELQMVLQAARTDPKCRLVVLNGTGGVFCSGVDLISLSNDQGSATAEKMSNAVRDFCKALLTFPKPLVAAVNGSAVGLGVTFLPFFDLVYASDKATFYTPYCKLGQIPECGATITFPSVMGYAKANGLLLEGQRLTATEALSTGLITQVLWPASFMEEVIPRVQAIANYPFDAVLHTKALVRYHAQSKLEVTLDTECRVLLQQWSSNVCRLAIRDFLRNEEVV